MAEAEDPELVGTLVTIDELKCSLPEDGPIGEGFNPMMS